MLCTTIQSHEKFKPSFCTKTQLSSCLLYSPAISNDNSIVIERYA